MTGQMSSMARRNREEPGKSAAGARKIYIDLLRIVAIILVIFNHTDGFYLYYTNTDNPGTFWYSMLGSVLCRVDVPLFLMIAGALLLGREESAGQVLRKRILRIAGALVLFSAVHYAVDIARGTVQTLSLLYFLRGILQGSLVYQYRYLYTYLGILLLLPLLRAWAKGMKPADYGYLLILETAMGVLLPMCSSLTGISYLSQIYVLSVNIFYVLMGYGLDNRIVELPCGRKEQELWSDRMVWTSLIFCVALGAGFCIMEYVLTGEFRQGDLEMVTPVLSVLVFEALRRFCAHHVFREKTKRWIHMAGSCVFGIYLTEQLIRMVLLPVYLYLTGHSVGVIACSVYVLGTFAAGLAVTMLLKRVPGIRRLL